MANEIFELTATELVTLISQRKLKSVDVVAACLARIAELDQDIHAWTSVYPDLAKTAATRIDASPSLPPMAGVPVGLKDNIATQGMVTTYGSPIYATHEPLFDAACVTLCKQAGLVTLGKTASTEFAYRSPSSCRNPVNPGHSPGGSSSGSAAAVAARMVPLAIGTQTGGSVIRPAAYCGIYGFKPRYADIPFAGVKNLAHTFDTLGLMARSLEDLSLFHTSLHGQPKAGLSDLDSPAPRLAIYRTAFWDEAQPCATECFETMLSQLSAAGTQLNEVRLDALDRDMLAASWIINKYEGSRHFLREWTDARDKLSVPARTLVEEGMSISYADYSHALDVFVRARQLFAQAMGEFDGILSISSPGEAPLGLDDTGPVTFNFIWTATYLPALTLPHFSGPNGLPVGMQVIGTSSHARLFDVGHWIDRQLQHLE